MKQWCEKNLNNIGQQCCESCKQVAELLADPCQDRISAEHSFTPAELKIQGIEFTSCGALASEYPELCRRYGQADGDPCCHSCLTVGNIYIVVFCVFIIFFNSSKIRYLRLENRLSLVGRLVLTCKRYTGTWPKKPLTFSNL